MADLPPGRDLIVRALLPSGLTVTAAATDCLTGATLTLSAPAEVPVTSGRYEATVPAAEVPRPMRVRVVWRDADGSQLADTYWQVGPIDGRALTRPALRRRILARLYDEEALRGFDAVCVGGTTSDVFAPNIVIGGVGEFRGHLVWFRSGACMGQERVVTSYSIPDRRLGWEPPLPVAPNDGDRIELSPLRATLVNDAIDDALTELRSQHYRSAVDCQLVTDGVTAEFPLPADARLVARVALLDQVTGQLVTWLAPGQWALGPNQTIRLGGVGSGYPAGNPFDWGGSTLVPPPAGLRVRLEMYVAVPSPVDDQMLLDAPTEAIVDTATLALATGMERLRALLPYLHQRANRSRALARTVLPPTGLEVIVA